MGYHLACRHVISTHIKIQSKYFVLFPCTWRIKLLNTPKTKASFWQFDVTFHLYLDIRGDIDDDDDDDGESSDEDYYEYHDDEKHTLIR